MLDLTKLQELLAKEHKNFPDFPDEIILKNISNNLSFLANFIPADLKLYQLLDDNNIKIIGEARPIIQPSFFKRSYIDCVYSLKEKVLLKKAKKLKNVVTKSGIEIFNEHPCINSCFPIFNKKNSIIGFLELYRNVHEEMRLAIKSSVYKDVIENIIKTIIYKSLYETRYLGAFLPSDGIVILNNDGVIIYVNPIVLNLIKKFNFEGTVEGSKFNDIFRSKKSTIKNMNFLYVEEQIIIDGITLNLKAVPITNYVIVILQDITLIYSKELEIELKSTIIKEVHHRVKNNLQTIVGILRLQKRRTDNIELKNILDETINRINSIAIVHEYLSKQELETVNLKEMINNIVTAILNTSIYPELKVNFNISISPEDITLSSKKTYSIVLILNELVLNCIKHAFKDRKEGNISIIISLKNNNLNILLEDDGVGFPPNFDIEKNANLGWRIISTLVKDNLNGEYKTENLKQGSRVIIDIPID